MPLSTGFQLYLAFLFPAIVSFLSSAAVILTYYILPELRKGSVYKHVICLHVADMIQTGSWFIGPKFSSAGGDRSVCAVQEYLFQYGSISKAFWASAICVLTYQSLLNMKLATGDKFIKKCVMCFGLTAILVAISAYYSTKTLFCGGHFHSQLRYDRETVYLIVVVGSLYLSILLNCVVTFLIYLKIRNMYSTSPDGAEDISRSRLLSLCKVLIFYPVISSIAWAPEVSYLFLRIFELGLFTGVSINSTGFLFALIFFSSNKTAKTFWGSYLSDKTSTVLMMGGSSFFLSFRSQQSTGETGTGSVFATELSSVSNPTSRGHQMSTDSFASHDDRYNSTADAIGANHLLSFNSVRSGNAPLGYR
jgi:hypothetical protein